MEKKLVYLLLSLPIFLFLACNNDDNKNSSSDEILGKWECYQFPYSLVDAKTDEVYYKVDGVKNHLGQDSIFMVTFYENGTVQWASDRNLHNFNREGNTLKIRMRYDSSIDNYIIDEITPNFLKLRFEYEYFDYDEERYLIRRWLYKFRRL